MEKYQKNIVMFPIEKQMDKIVREAKRIERKSYELLKRFKKMQENMDGKR